MIDLMDEYFGQQNLLVESPQISTKRLPVQKEKKFDWETKDNPPRFYRKIKFKSHETFLNFLIALLQYEDEVKHNAKITIGYPEIIIQIWTHGLESITDMDREYCKEVESILSEVYR